VLVFDGDLALETIFVIGAVHPGDENLKDFGAVVAKDYRNWRRCCCLSERTEVG
jgi:hypothetical protein